MPNRWGCILILLLWVSATTWFLQRDMIPRWFVGAPPSLRGMTQSDRLPPPSSWKLLLPEPPKTSRTPESEQSRAQELKQREVGRLITSAVWDNQTPRGMIFHSIVQLDAGRLVQKTPLERLGPGQLRIETTTHLNDHGDLVDLRVTLHGTTSNTLLLTMNGQRIGDRLTVVAKDTTGAVLLKQEFPYTAGGGLQAELNPLENYRGLQVGQSWRTRVVNPMTRTVQDGIVTVKSQGVIRWQGRFVETHELVTEMKPFSARTWARTGDGQIIRQEVPIPLFNLILEREESFTPETRAASFP